MKPAALSPKRLVLVAVLAMLGATALAIDCDPAGKPRPAWDDDDDGRPRPVELPPLRGYTAAHLIVDARYLHCLQALPPDRAKEFRALALAAILDELAEVGEDDVPAYAERVIDECRRAHARQGYEP